MKKENKSIRLTFNALLISLTIALMLCFLSNYKVAPDDVSARFQSTVSKQMQAVDQKVTTLLPELATNYNRLVSEFSTNTTNTAAYLYENASLRAWSTNEFAFRFPALKHPDSWNYNLSSNVHALYKWYTINDSVGMLVMIPLQYAFPYENQYLKNTFFSPFTLVDKLQLSTEQSGANFPIHDESGQYLFSISFPATSSPDSLITWIGFAAWSSSFLLLLLLFAQAVFLKKNKPERFFLLLTLLYTTIFSILAFTDFPRLFFVNPVFTPIHFTLNELISSLTHLSLFIFTGATFLFTYVLKFKSVNRRAISLLMWAIYLWLLIEFLNSTVIHSDFQINVYLFTQISFVTIWIHLLLFIFLLAGFGVTHLAFPRFVPVRMSTLTIYLTIATLLCLGFTHHLHQNKKLAKYSILTENSRINGTSRQDPMTELLLEELVLSVETDTLLKRLALDPDSLSTLYSTVSQRYTSLLNAQYDIEIELLNTRQEATREYLSLIQRTGNQVGKTNFYNLPSSLYDTSYAGIIRIPGMETESFVLFLEFRNKRNFRSYSLPDLLINESSASQLQKDISIASYENGKLVYNDQQAEWPEDGKKFVLANDGFEKIKSGKEVFYIHQYQHQQVVLTERQHAGKVDKLFYFVLILVVYLLLARIVYFVNQVLRHHQPLSLGLTGKFQLVFVFLLMVSFIITLVFSVQYFRKNYEQEQLQTSESKRHYIQSSLQETFYWLNDITSIDEQGITNILQELAYRYQTDIHIYNQHGELAGSSQNLLFSKQLISKLIHPEVLFSESVPLHRHEKIGELTYLTSYAQLINGDFVPLGYIAIPQYFSQTEINAKINQFLMAVVQIYTLIIILSILLLLLAGNRLATPLRLMEEKLKTMKLNGKNSRIDYRGYDEIGQLVEQYNRTVDELERSTQLLLKSERESAWRTMARQVAHEINNPLTPMKLTIQQLQRVRNQAPEQFDEYFKTTTTTLIEQIDNLSRIAGTFSQFARLPETEMQTIDIAARLFSTVELFRANSEAVEVRYSGAREGLLMKGDPEQLSRVFTNLLKNALQSIPSHRPGTIAIQVAVINHNQVEIAVSDNGSGIPEETKKNIFKPDFTTKSSGMGLGLSISRAIVENSGGTIFFDTEEDKGTTFTIRLPLLP